MATVKNQANHSMDELRKFGCAADWKGWSQVRQNVGEDYLVAIKGASESMAMTSGAPSSSNMVALVCGNLAGGLGNINAQAQVKVLCPDRVAAYLAFIDKGLHFPIGRSGPRKDCVVCFLPKNACEDDSSLRRWLAYSVLVDCPQARDMLGWLRIREAYTLVGYLLMRHVDSRTRIADICKEYGLSSSHFRKTCKRLTGCSAKSILMECRSVHALVDILTTDRCVLNIGMVNGYATASHISNEIQKRFGSSPSDFRKDSIFTEKVE